MVTSPSPRRLDERGAAFVLIAVMLVLCISVAALAVDVGLLATARTEAQRTADMAAHAGASALVLSPNSEAAARSEAILFAAKNDIRGEASVILPEDVEVMLDESKVRVTVHRTVSRGRPVGTFFARLLGVDEVDIRAMAAAVARPAGAADENDTWDPDEGDVYGDGGMGYGEGDLGTLITLKPAQGAAHGNDGGGDDTEDPPDSNRFESGWWYLWYPTGGGGAKTLREQVLDCPQPSTPWGVDDWVTDKNGNTQSIQKAFNELVDRDPGARWDDECKCVINSAYPVSPRLRAVPVFNPETYTKQGSGPNFQISDFMGLFVVRGPPGPPGQQSAYAHIASIQGLVGGGGPTTGPLVKAVQIVE